MLGLGCQPAPAPRSAAAPQVAVAASEPAPAKSVLKSEEVEQLWLSYSALTDAERKSAFIDQHVGALTETYVARHEQLEQPTRTRLIELLSECRDPRTEPALRVALQTFVRQRPTDRADADIKWVFRAAADLKLPGLSQPLIEAFAVFEAHTLLGGVAYKDLAQAMFEIADPSWAPTLRAKLDAHLIPPKTREDAHLIDAYRDQLFWQTCAAQVLGTVQDREAVEPLFRVLLDPAKSDLVRTAVMALVKIGRPARTTAAELLLGKRPDLVQFSETRAAAAPGAPPAAPDAPAEIAAAVLGTSGHIDAKAPLLEFLNTGPKPTTAVRVAGELAKLPPDEATKAAFKKVLFATPKTLDVSEGVPARELLLEAAVGLLDPVVVEWCLDMLRSEVAQDARAARTRSAGLATALSLVDPKRLPLLRRFVDAGKEPEFQREFEQVATLLDACKANATCYLGELSKDGLPEPLVLKAGTMVGVYGDASARDALISLLDRYPDARVRFVFARSIDHLTPNGSLRVAQRLQEIVDADQAHADHDRIAADWSIIQVIARLEGRQR